MNIQAARHFVANDKHRELARKATRHAVLLATLAFCWTPNVVAAGSQPLTDTQEAWLSKAYRHEKAGWVYLHIEGGPRERGFQHGYLLANEIAEGLKATRIDWEFATATEWSWVVDKTASMFTKKVDKENLAEIEGIVEGLQAAGFSTSRDEIITYNASIEIWYWWPEELEKIKDGKEKLSHESCSAFIATGSMTTNGGVVMGHNTMGGYQGASSWNVIVDIAPEQGHRILMQAPAGWIHSGSDFFITDAGLVGTETTIGWYEGFDPKGVPEFSRMRRATQDADSIVEWCDIMKKGNNGAYANAWLLGDVNTGEIARLELGLKYVGFERKRDGYFIGSNIAEDRKILRFETSGHDTDIRGSDVARRVRWQQLMSQNVGKIDLEMAKAFEADHFDTYLGRERLGTRTLCDHSELEAEPPYWHVPFDPAGTFDAKAVDAAMAKRMSFAVRWGSACGTAFDAQKFLSEHPQFEWMKDILQSRPSQPWTEFTAGEKE